MKIVVTVRTRNEAKNIDRFCQCYAWADHILVADGGSEDDTVERAKQYPNVKVANFGLKVHRGDYWRNPHGQHINFLIDWALDHACDWIIFDDCDCVPMVELQRLLRHILENTRADIITLYRLYIWGEDKYLPTMNKPGQSLYAWRSSVPVRAREDDPWQHHINIPKLPVLALDLDPVLALDYSFCCLHYFSPDEETVNRKLKFYHESGELPGVQHPLANGGPLEKLPDWARWK